ncbi:MAG: beta-galactosidase [Candidatus Omnitrophica bacterium]|nr:beta-galactosidase [Candidatus Omnitrophota bacterium]
MRYLILALVLAGVVGVAHAEEGWFPFSYGKDLDSNSLLNMGKLVLDPPAGKHGFAKAAGNHFVFEDGTPTRFFGTNLYFEACFPTHKQAEIIAERLAFFGFNAVRLHHMDFYFEPKGIFEDICPAFKNPQMKKTGILSKKQLERLDYLIYQLKIRGIYVDLNLLVGRHFTEADGVKDADKLVLAAKPASVFDEKLIALQKQYTKDLLTHYNPYTKLRYYEEPAIALIEITNENSLLDSWYDDKLNGDMPGFKTNPIPVYYSKELNKLWNIWLQDKYKTVEAVKTSWLSISCFNDVSKFDFQIPVHKLRALVSKKCLDDFRSFLISLEKRYFSIMLNLLKSEIKIKVPITGIGGCSNVEELEAQEQCDFLDKHAYWDHPRFPHKTWDQNDFTIKNNSILQNASFGMMENIDKFNLRKKPFTVTEWNHCYPNKYAYETPPLMGAYAVKNDWSGIFQYALTRGWQFDPVYDVISSYFDTFANAQQLSLSAIGSFIVQRCPDINVVVNNDSATFESDFLCGVTGFIGGKEFHIRNLTVNSDKNGSIFIYSPDLKEIGSAKTLICLVVGEIKNEDSQWDSQKMFNWGIKKTVLSAINAKIGIGSFRPGIVYALDNQGKRSRIIPSSYISDKLVFTTNKADTLWYEISLK